LPRVLLKVVARTILAPSFPLSNSCFHAWFDLSFSSFVDSPSESPEYYFCRRRQVVYSSYLGLYFTMASTGCVRTHHNTFPPSRSFVPVTAFAMVWVQGQDQTHSHILPAVHSLCQRCPTLILKSKKLGSHSDRHALPVLSGHPNSVSVAAIECLASGVTSLHDTSPGLPSHQGRPCLAALLQNATHCHAATLPAIDH
jgi:hypothetical protein